MKKIALNLLVMGAALASFGVASAQTAGPAGGPPKVAAPRVLPRLNRMRQEAFAKLGLTRDQKAKIKALNAELRQKVKPLVAERKAGAKVDRKAVQALRKDYRNQVMQVLTPDQRSQFKALMRDALAKFRAAHPRNP